MSKVIVVGLDGGSWNILKPLAEEGVMSNLRELMDHGIYGILKSTIPPLTAPAWASFMTGKNPSKHGLFSFFERDPQTGDFRICSSRDIKSPKLWHYINQKGKSTGVYNLEFTYPPDDVNGFMIPVPPSYDVNFQTYPDGLIYELIKECGDYLAKPNPKDIGPNDIEEMRKVTANRTKTAIYLYRKYKPDFFFVMYKAPDHLQHRYWGYIDPHSRHSNCPEANTLKHSIKEVFTQIDKGIGEILSLASEDTYLILVSDHGFGPLNYKLNLNVFLESKGFLKVNKLRMYFLYILANLRVGPNELIKIPSFMGGAKAAYILAKSINWKHTVAFSSTSCETGVFLNRIVVRQDNEEQILKNLKEILMTLLDKNRNKLVKNVFSKYELYEGPNIQKAPDLVIELNPGCMISQKLISQNIFRRVKEVEIMFDSHEGYHQEDGIYLISGPEVRPLGKWEQCNILDIFPTILYLMGVPIPKDIDGKVQMKWFKESRMPAPKYCTPLPYKQHKEFEFSDTEKKYLLDMLRGLGYLD